MAPTGFGVRKKGPGKVDIFQNLPLNGPEIQAPLAPLRPYLHPTFLTWDTLSCGLKRIKGPFVCLPSFPPHSQEPPR